MCASASGARAARPPVSAGGVDFVEAAQIAGERVGLAFDRMGAEVLEQIVVRVDAVERGIASDGFREDNRADRR